jgi:hypothetical protein
MKEPGYPVSPVSTASACPFRFPYEISPPPPNGLRLSSNHAQHVVASIGQPGAVDRSKHVLGGWQMLEHDVTISLSPLTWHMNSPPLPDIPPLFIQRKQVQSLKADRLGLVFNCPAKCGADSLTPKRESYKNTAKPWSKFLVPVKIIRSKSRYTGGLTVHMCYPGNG